jgi:nicotinamidase-related amidase
MNTQDTVMLSGIYTDICAEQTIVAVSCFAFVLVLALKRGRVVVRNDNYCVMSAELYLHNLRNNG